MRRGVSDWHPDSARYLVQEKQYIKGSYRPIGSTPLYTGNPYANILILSALWRGLDKISIWMGYDHIPLTNLNLSLVGRLFYLFLCILLTITLYFFASHVFRSTHIGLLAALLWCLSPLSINQNHMIKPEIPLTFFLTIAAVIAFYTSESDRWGLYAAEGITAGITAAVKYNGAIVLLYFFTMHAYRVLMKERPIGNIGTVRKLFSLRLFMAAILSILVFYAFEPILWLGLPKGILYIHQYLHTAAYTATPPEFKFHGGAIAFLLYSLKTIPHNLWVFAHSAHPIILILSILALIIPHPSYKSQRYRIALFPFIILLVLLSTKPLIAAEYLLHFQPFIFILAAFGLYIIYALVSSYKFKCAKAIASLPIILTVVICLYASLYEITYFSIGNIRYHASQWAKKNLKGQCVLARRHTIAPDSTTCGKNPPVAIARYTKTFFQPYPGSIVLKTFNLEKSKPLIHLIRGYKIRFYGLRNFFDNSNPPLVPLFPSPHSSKKEKRFVRFINGVNLNPHFNSFFLHPNTTYTWTLVSKNPKNSFTCLIISGDHKTTLRSHNLPKPFTLLPYEHRVFSIPVFPRFPWRSPYLYSITIHSTQYLFFRLLPQKTQCKKFSTFPSNNFIPSEITSEQAASCLTSFDDGSANSFRKAFRSIYHYDFSLLEKFLSLQIPLKKLSRSYQTRLFFKANGPNDNYLWTKAPIFLEKGDYILEATGDIILTPHSKITFLITTLGTTLRKITIPSNDKNICWIPNYSIKIPFHVPSDAPAYLIIIFRGKSKASIKKITIRYPFESAFKIALQKKVILHFLKDKKSQNTLSNYIATYNPSSFPTSLCFQIGSTFLYLKKERKAIRWLKYVITADPLNKNAYILLAKAYQRLSLLEKAKKMTERAKNLSKIVIGPWQFETGLCLQGFTMPNHFMRNQKIPVTIYLSLPAFNGDQSAFISFYKDNNFRFAKDFSLLQAKPVGKLYKISGNLAIPKGIPSGVYNVYFTFRIPKIDYRYHVLKKGKILPEKKIFVGKIKIIDK